MSNKFKAILINSKAETVSLVEVEDSVGAYNKLIGSDCYTGGPRRENNDGVLVDDEGMLKVTPESKFFLFDTYPQPLAGNGLILGARENGETQDVQSTVEEITKLVKFLDFPTVKQGIEANLWE